ncbi:glycosyltransferase [Opitutales bacterium]|nr:glycosyltransferase [Opitutales bacterium]
MDYFFSIVIPTFERPEDLRTCLDSLSQENQRDAPIYELIVTDDSKSDFCKNVVLKDFPDAKWGKGKQNGPAGNRNAGVSRAKGKWIIFIDDDCIAQKDYIAAYADAIYRNPSIYVFEGKIFAERKRMTWSEGCPENENGGMLWTSNLCVKKSVFTDLSGLDERFLVSYEDVDFAYRLKKEKYDYVFVREAAVCHPWRSLRKKSYKNWKKSWHDISSLLIFCEKHNYENKEYSKSRIYLKNLLRIITKDLYNCIFHLKTRGIDILLKDALVSLIVFILLFIQKIKR